MRPRGASRGAHVADDLPLLHARAGSQPFHEARQMGVSRLIACAMTQPHHVAVRPGASHEAHDPSRGSNDGSTYRRRKIGAVVRLDALQDGMEALEIEARADPETRHGPAPAAAAEH